jgi:hypothetical protein
VIDLVADNNVPGEITVPYRLWQVDQRRGLLVGC